MRNGQSQVDISCLCGPVKVILVDTASMTSEVIDDIKLEPFKSMLVRLYLVIKTFLKTFN